MCILATDDEDVKDVALQIHFTLIQAFCCENEINILRVNNTRRLAEILSGGGSSGDGQQSGGEPMDLHCLLVTVSVSRATLVSPRDFSARVWSSGAAFQEELASTCSCSRSKHVRDGSFAQTPWNFSCGSCFACPPVNFMQLQTPMRTKLFRRLTVSLFSNSRARIPRRGTIPLWAKWVGSAGRVAAWTSGCPSSTCPSDELSAARRKKKNLWKDFHLHRIGWCGPWWTRYHPQIKFQSVAEWGKEILEEENRLCCRLEMCLEERTKKKKSSRELIFPPRRSR